MSVFTVLNPATEEPVTTVAQASAEEAAGAARKGAGKLLGRGEKTRGRTVIKSAAVSGEIRRSRVGNTLDSRRTGVDFLGKGEIASSRSRKLRSIPAG